MHLSRNLAVIFLFALTVRVVVGIDRDRWPGVAEEAEWENAALVFESSGLLTPDNIGPRPPLYPFLMAAVYLASGTSAMAIRIVQAILGSVTCLIAFSIGQRSLGERAGLVAATFCAAHPLFVFQAGMLTSDTLLVLLVAISVLLAVTFVERPTHGRGFALGASLGLAVLCSQVVLAWVPLVLGMLIHRCGRPIWGPLSKVVCAMLLVILPWTIRNHIVTDRLVPVAQRAGLDLLIGHESQANGRYSEAQNYLGLFVRLSDDTENYVDRDRQVFSRVAGWMFEDPLRSLRLGLQKLFHLWNPFPAGSSRGANLLALAVVVPVVVLGLVGAIGHRRAPIGWLALTMAVAFSIVHAVLYAEARFRLPVDVALLVPAGDRGIRVATSLWARIRTRWHELADGDARA